jgi:hypothetical protein
MVDSSAFNFPRWWFWTFLVFAAAAMIGFGFFLGKIF